MTCRPFYKFCIQLRWIWPVLAADHRWIASAAHRIAPTPTDREEDEAPKGAGLRGNQRLFWSRLLRFPGQCLYGRGFWVEVLPNMLMVFLWLVVVFLKLFLTVNFFMIRIQKLFKWFKRIPYRFRHLDFGFNKFLKVSIEFSMLNSWESPEKSLSSLNWHNIQCKVVKVFMHVPKSFLTRRVECRRL